MLDRGNPPIDLAPRVPLRRILEDLVDEVGLRVNPDRDRPDARFLPAGVTPPLDAEQPVALPAVDRLEPVRLNLVSGVYRTRHAGVGVEVRGDEDRDAEGGVSRTLHRMHLLAGGARIRLVRLGGARPC